MAIPTSKPTTAPVTTIQPNSESMDVANDLIRNGPPILEDVENALHNDELSEDTLTSVRLHLSLFPLTGNKQFQPNKQIKLKVSIYLSLIVEMAWELLIF
jgi:hypothetical protein